MQKMRLGDRLVGEDEPCFIVAEAGSNYDGKLEIAKRLIKAAKDARADGIKFQTFRAELGNTKLNGLVDYQWQVSKYLSQADPGAVLSGNQQAISGKLPQSGLHSYRHT